MRQQEGITAIISESSRDSQKSNYDKTQEAKKNRNEEAEK